MYVFHGLRTVWYDLTSSAVFKWLELVVRVMLQRDPISVPDPLVLQINEMAISNYLLVLEIAQSLIRLVQSLVRFRTEGSDKRVKFSNLIP
jgi:hypothetical protein